MTKTTSKYIKNIFITILSILALSLFITMIINQKAKDKGIDYLESKNQYSVIEKLKINTKTPDEDRLPKILNNKLIYVYQYGCKDCYENNENIKEIFKKEKIKPYNIPYGSKELEKLKDIEIKEVPMLIYVDPSGETFYTQMAKRENGETKLLKENIKKLIKDYKIDNNRD